MAFVEVKTSELTGAALDWAVGSAQGWVTYPNDSIERGDIWHTDPEKAPFGRTMRVANFQPSTNWNQGGPLIDKHIIDLTFTYGGPGFYARHRDKPCDGDQQYGETALIATCRAHVFAKLGDAVNVPAELIQ